MDLLTYLWAALTPMNLGLALISVFFGTLIGALPGLSATMAVAVLVPFTFTMDPASGLIMLGSIYTGAIYGGAYAAILVNTPGTPSAIATTFDGFPMAKRGDGALAITVATLSSVVGGLVGALLLLLVAPPLAEVALRFGPPEYFWLAVLGLTLIAALSVGNTIKGIIACLIGLFISTIGVAAVGGDVRFTLDNPELVGGVNVVVGLIGLYCIPVVIDLVIRDEPHLEVKNEQQGFRLLEALAFIMKDKFNLVRSSVLGTLIGMLPGAGGSIASLVSYTEARRSSRESSKFGTGHPSGLVATESANNAIVGGGFIPTLVLGIPGTPPDAIILGALLVQGIKIGPTLFTEQASISYTFIFGLLIATVLMLPVGLLIGRYAYRGISSIPKAALVPLIAFLTVIGSFAIQNNFVDVVIMLSLGILGWVLNRAGFSPSPIALGLVLGSIAEQGFVQSYLIGNAQQNVLGQFFGSPISIAIIVAIVLGLTWPVYQSFKGRRKIKPKEENAETTLRSSLTLNIFSGVCAAALGVFIYMNSRGLSAMGSIFPNTIAAVLVVMGALLIVATCLPRARRQGKRPEANASNRDQRMPEPKMEYWRGLALVSVMITWLASMNYIGMVASSILAFAALALVTGMSKLSLRTLTIIAVCGVGVVAGFTTLMTQVLLIPIPRGIFF